MEKTSSDSSVETGSKICTELKKKSFTNMWEWYNQEVEPEPISQLVVTRPTPKEVWRPRRCHLKGSLYEFVDDHKDQSLDKEPTPVPTPPSKAPKLHVKICIICRRIPVDPIQFDCGHLCCRICVAKLRPLLLQDYSEVIKDHRATIRCPLPTCQHNMLCRPLVNGEFRFNTMHPEEKVKIDKLTLCERQALKTFRVSIDIDFTRSTRTSVNSHHDSQ